MIISNPYYTIFKLNNWFFSKEMMKITYSDEVVSIKDVYLFIPFKDDTIYNKKIMKYFSIFLKNLQKIIQLSLNISIEIKHNLSVYQSNPINVHISEVENNTLIIKSV